MKKELNSRSELINAMLYYDSINTYSPEELKKLIDNRTLHQYIISQQKNRINFNYIKDFREIPNIIYSMFKHIYNSIQNAPR